MDWKIWSMAILVIGLILGMVFGVSMAMGTDAKVINPGQVYIKVIDENGDPVENATVEAITNTSQIVKSSLTDKNGEVILDMSTSSNFTGIIKVTKDGYKDAQVNITFNNDKSYAYTFTLEKSSNNYIDKAKDIYEEHKTAVIAGGAIIILLLLFVVLGGGKKIKW